MELITLQVRQLAHEFNSLAGVVQATVDTVKELGVVIADIRVKWLPTVGGNWPDRFVLLNRYLRTDVEPEYFSDGRWTA